MTQPELRVFRDGGREFRAHRSDEGRVVLSEWAAQPGEEWERVSEFSLSDGELRRLVAWGSEEEASSAAPVLGPRGDGHPQGQTAADSDPGELDDAIARGEAQLVNPTSTDWDGQIPPPKARGAFKRPPA